MLVFIFELLRIHMKTKKTYNMNVKMTPILIGSYGTVPKGKDRRLDKLEIRIRIETFETPVLLRSPRTLGRDLET